ncbi:PepSY domain-containing protein [Bacillota bacterium Lsc_1132]
MSKKKWLIPALAMTIVGGSLAGVSLTKSYAASPTKTVQTEENSKDDAAVLKQATLTKAESESIALKAVAGTVKSSELENENGSAVYGVQIVDKAGKTQDVKVDAKTGKVLKVEADDNEKDRNGKENDGEQANQ